MQKTVNFKKKIIASAIASLAGFGSMAFAQDEGDEIVITGIKASLQASMDLKKNAVGVVDAISAEDIGKMPDTNLAESLQRITGVSIDRAGGEGSKATVRGFGPDYNLVTLNGRAMPSSGFDSRSFEFADLASESVSGLEVYKTGRADTASGGIGATINIKTARPLDNPGFKASVGVKAVNDTTVRTGDDVTPEVSGIISNTFADDMFGVTLSAVYQKRDQGNSGAYSQQWNTRAWDTSRGYNNITSRSNAVIQNAPSNGQLFSTPIDYRLILGDQERERTNGQLTFQFKPTDKIVATLDYTYSELDWHQERIEQSLWFVGTGSQITFDNEKVKTPVLMTELIDNPKDISFARQVQGNHRENNAIGLNVEFEATDKLSFTADYFKADAETREYDPRGNLNLSVAANVVKVQSMNWNPALPIMSVAIDDKVSGNGSGKLDAGDMTTTAGTTNYNWVENDMEQARLNAVYKFGDDSSLEFGVESRTNDYLGRSRGDCCIVFGDWGGADAKNVPDSFWTPRNFLADFEGYNLGTSFTGGMDWDFNEVADWVASQNGKLPNFRDFPPSGKFEAKPRVTTYRGIVEDVQGAFLQYNMSSEVSGMPYHVLAGVRYEKTDITSSTQAANPTAINWTGDDDFTTTRSDTLSPFSQEASYDHVLPSVDFDISFSDELKGRVSLSKTIARPTYGNLRADIGVGDFRNYTADSGSPGLLPLESKNFDLSLEWYYGDSSYLSAGYYRKDVDNFNSTSSVDGNLFGLRDVTKGQRAQAALAQLKNLGINTPSAQQLYSQVLKNEGQIPANADINFGWNGKVVPNETDPLAVWHISKPINNKAAVIDGFEVAVQHMFGESGYGVTANYTTVNGDIAFDNNKLGGQFALVGLSDSANASVFYDKDGLQARIAYNWRDQFLDTANQYNNEPGYTESFESFDASISYEFTEQITVSLEGLNLLGEDKRRHGRTQVQMWNLDIWGPRYTLGARYTF